MGLMQIKSPCVGGFDLCSATSRTNVVGGGGITEGAYNSGKPGKHGNVGEFVNSGKLRENSGTLKFTPGIYQMLFFRDAI